MADAADNDPPVDLFRHAYAGRSAVVATAGAVRPAGGSGGGGGGGGGGGATMAAVSGNGVGVPRGPPQGLPSSLFGTPSALPELLSAAAAAAAAASVPPAAAATAASSFPPYDVPVLRGYPSARPPTLVPSSASAAAVAAVATAAAGGRTHGGDGDPFLRRRSAADGGPLMPQLLPHSSDTELRPPSVGAAAAAMSSTSDVSQPFRDSLNLFPSHLLNPFPRPPPYVEGDNHLSTPSLAFPESLSDLLGGPEVAGVDIGFPSNSSVDLEPLSGPQTSQLASGSKGNENGEPFHESNSSGKPSAAASDASTNPQQLELARMPLSRHVTSVITHFTASKEGYRRLINEVDDFLHVIDPAGEILYAGPAATRHLGIATPDALVGRPLSDLLHPEDRQIVADAVASAITSPTRDEYTVFCRFCRLPAASGAAAAATAASSLSSSDATPAPTAAVEYVVMDLKGRPFPSDPADGPVRFLVHTAREYRSRGSASLNAVLELRLENLRLRRRLHESLLARGVPDPDRAHPLLRAEVTDPAPSPHPQDLQDEDDGGVAAAAAAAADLEDSSAAATGSVMPPVALSGFDDDETPPAFADPSRNRILELLGSATATSGADALAAAVASAPAAMRSPAPWAGGSATAPLLTDSRPGKRPAAEAAAVGGDAGDSAAAELRRKKVRKIPLAPRV
ncbi:hypothetical protein HK405_011622 [Cladochytrium tenue]|nr:hypothetical protein HK405_011622 [Cladochytrium tenue]